jgi:hypothetical protein
MKSDRELQIRTNWDSYLAFWSPVITNRSADGGDDNDMAFGQSFQLSTDLLISM